MKPLGYIIIQNEDTKYAIENFQFDPEIHKDKYADLNAVLNASNEDANGLPKKSLAIEDNIIVEMVDPTQFSKIVATELNDDRWYISKKVMSPLWNYMLKPMAEGGLKIGNPPRDVKHNLSDYVPLDDSYNAAVEAQIKPIPPPG